MAKDKKMNVRKGIAQIPSNCTTTVKIDQETFNKLSMLPAHQIGMAILAACEMLFTGKCSMLVEEPIDNQMLIIDINNKSK